MTIREVYKDFDAPDFVSLTEEMESRGAKGVELAILKKIVDFSLFANAEMAVSPEQWLHSLL